MRKLKIKENSLFAGGRSKILDNYLKEVNKYRVLTPDEEYEIGVKAFEGDKEAREKLVKHNLRFVVSVAKQYQNNNIKVEDLINEGNIGLIKSAETFDPSLGFKFISYAVWGVRQRIINHINGTGRTIKMGLNKTNRFTNISKVYHSLEQKLERTPSKFEILEESNGDYSEDDVFYYLQDKFNFIKSLDAPLSATDDSFNLIDLISSNDSSNELKDITEYDGSLRINTLLNELKPNYSNILILLYGLDGNKPLTVNEVAEELNVSRTRICTIRDKSLRILKHRLLNTAKWMRDIN